MESLEPKIRALASQRDEALSMLDEARRDNERLRDEIRQMRERVHEKELEAEYLSVSHKLADNPQALAQARTAVRRMLAKVEKAIALLDDDARV